jgi:hypothetical protein
MWPVESATRSSEVRSEVPPTPSPFAPPSAPLPVEYAPQRDLVSDMLKINQQQVQLPHDLFLQWPIDFGESFPFFNFFNEQY